MYCVATVLFSPEQRREMRHDTTAEKGIPFQSDPRTETKDCLLAAPATVVATWRCHAQLVERLRKNWQDVQECDVDETQLKISIEQALEGAGLPTARGLISAHRRRKMRASESQRRP